MNCPKCGKSHIVKSGSNRGKQRYQCKDCKHRFVLNPAKVYKEHYEKECPACHYPYARKAGKYKERQLYICKACNHKFSEEPMQRRVTEGDRKYIRKLHFSGVTNKDIAKRTGFSIKTIFNTLRDVKEKKVPTKTPVGELKKEIMSRILNGEALPKVARESGFEASNIRDMLRFAYSKETLSKEEKELLLTFGVNCNVPVDYLAPYIHCSQRICKEFFKKYRGIRRKKRRPLTNTEKAFDKIELDRFIK